MVGGDYIAHSTPGETRHSPKSDRAHVHTRNACVYRRIRVLNYSRDVRRWLDSTLHVCMFIRLQGSGCSAFLSLFPSLSIHPFRSVRSQCFLLRSPPSNVHLSRVSDEELIAPESLALLSSSQTDGPDMGRSSLFVRTWLPVSSSRRECARARAPVCVTRGCIGWRRTYAPRAARGSRRVFGHRIPARFVRGSRMSGLRGQPDCKIIVQTAFRARGVLMEFISRRIEIAIIQA